MDAGSIAKWAIVGGIVAIVLEFIVGAAAGAASAATYDIGFIVLLIGGFVSGWMLKSNHTDNAVAGAVSGLIYIVLGVLIIFPVFTHKMDSAGVAVVAIIVGLILGAIGGVVGGLLASPKKSSQKSSKPRKKR